MEIETQSNIKNQHELKKNDLNSQKYLNFNKYGFS